MGYAYYFPDRSIWERRAESMSLDRKQAPMTDEDPQVDADVLVVGGGPVGTLLAAEVKLGGGSVVVIERDGEHAETIKAHSINLASAEILERRGLGDAARTLHDEAVDGIVRLFAGPSGAAGHDEAAQRIRRQVPRAGHFAAIPLDGDLVDESDADVAAHREALGATLVRQREVERLLDGHAERLGVPIRRGVTVTGLTQHDDHVEVDTSQGTLTCRWLVGCDGGRSLVRHLVGVEFPGSDPEITGRQATVEFADGEGEKLAPGWHWSTRGVYRLGPQPGVVLTVEFGGPPARRDEPVTASEIEASLRRVSATDVAVAHLNGEATRWTDNARQAVGYRRDRVLLCGDAAHVHSPFSGQGLNLGLGDATNLGWKLAATLAGWAPDGLLDTYTAERHPLGEWVLDWTRAQVALMRPDEKTGRQRDVFTDLMTTRDGMTRIVKLISGITQRIELAGGDDEPLLGRLVPDITLVDGEPLRARFTTGRFVLLDRTPDAQWTAAAAPWSDRVVAVGDMGVAAPAGLLARPDGVIVWAAADAGAAQIGPLVDALTRWAGEPPSRG